MILIELAIGLTILCLGSYFTLILIAKLDERFKIGEKLKKWLQ